MRTKMFVPTLLSTLLASLTTGAIHAQGTGPVAFDATNSALTGTVACNGGQPTAITPVDASTSDLNGGLSDVTATYLSATDCGLPLYSIESAQDAAYTSDTGSSDVGNGGDGIQQVSLLGGLLTYQAKVEYDLCGASASGNTATINCQDSTQIQNLVFAGQPITGTYTQPTTFNAIAAQVTIPSYCTGLALFTGSLTVDSTSQQQSGDTGTITSAPVALSGTLTCVGLPLTSMTVSLQDGDLIEYALLSGFVGLATLNATVTLAANLSTTFEAANVANPTQ
ncbi:hypothetical protein DWU98_11880 [Dyella monticola]|uniref:Uncharacterized protein n=1 Tax=Dyella monticola TaxID=1927958 RepID=A0A370WYZ8_9GAMM|nr:hypothetical protein [Dyella monticola]RDS81227.1 hypothetical protein DWU98_11880 [Dyella monticola]